MRDIILILSMLLLWVFTAKAFGMYSPTSDDVALLSTLEEKIDTIQDSDPARLHSIQDRIPSVLEILTSDTQARYVIHELFLYIEKITTNTGQYSNELIRLLAREF